MKGLVTGFDAFGGLKSNPSSTVSRLLAEEDESLTSVILPTSFSRGWELLDHTLRAESYDFAVLFGYARRARGLRLERRGTNRSRPSAKDNDGQSASEVISADSAKHLYTLFDLEALREAVLDNTYCAVEISTDAGGYVCNFVYFQVLDKHPSLPCVFVHLSANEGSLTFASAYEGAKALVHKIQRTDI